MSLKQKGIRAERELIHLLWQKSWAAIRVAGSGSMQFPSPDILAGNGARVLAIECKVTKSKIKYFSKEEVKQLQNFSSYFGAESWLAIRFQGEQWYFLNIEDLSETKNNLSISREMLKIKGLLLEELLNYDSSQGL